MSVYFSLCLCESVCDVCLFVFCLCRCVFVCLLCVSVVGCLCFFAYTFVSLCLRVCLLVCFRVCLFLRVFVSVCVFGHVLLCLLYVCDMYIHMLACLCVCVLFVIFCFCLCVLLFVCVLVLFRSYFFVCGRLSAQVCVRVFIV